jgi:hypothetical protein
MRHLSHLTQLPGSHPLVLISQQLRRLHLAQTHHKAKVQLAAAAALVCWMACVRR